MPAALAGTAQKLEANCRWEYDDLPYWGGEVDVCINAMTLANGAWLGADMTALAEWFPEHQLADGGWNCEWIEGSTRSSFHSTINALRGIRAYEEFAGRTPELHAAASALRSICSSGDCATGCRTARRSAPGRPRCFIRRATSSPH